MDSEPKRPRGRPKGSKNKPGHKARRPSGSKRESIQRQTTQFVLTYLDFVEMHVASALGATQNAVDVVMSTSKGTWALSSLRERCRLTFFFNLAPENRCNVVENDHWIRVDCAFNADSWIRGRFRGRNGVRVVWRRSVAPEHA